MPYRVDADRVIALLGARLEVGDELKVQLSVGSVSDGGLTLPGIITGFSVP